MSSVGRGGFRGGRVLSPVCDEEGLESGPQKRHEEWTGCEHVRGEGLPSPGEEKMTQYDRGRR